MRSSMIYLKAFFQSCTNLNSVKHSMSWIFFFSFLNLPLSKLYEQKKHYLTPPSQRIFFTMVLSTCQMVNHLEEVVTLQIFINAFQRNIPNVICLYNDFIQSNMPPLIKTAIISLVPKPGKDCMDLSKYSPLSPLNNGYKLFKKMLAKRLGKSCINCYSSRSGGLYLRAASVH